MAQTQFRSDDTERWVYKFGNGSDGAYAPSTGTDAPIDSACSGSVNTNLLTASNGSFAAGQLILIHQTQGSNAGVWELNRIESYTPGTITTSFNLKNNYASGAQVLVIPQHSSGNIAGGVTVSVKPWNGTTGGIYAKFVNGIFNIDGTLAANGAGYRGGNGASNTNTGAFRGENYNGTGYNDHSQSANLSAGGGGFFGAGAGYNGTVAYQSDPNLVTRFVPGSAGGGGNSNSGAGGQGGFGGAIVLIIAKVITVTGFINANGSNGTVGAGNQGAGGSAAGGCILLKGQVITLGSSLVTASGGTTDGSATADPGGVGAGSEAIAGQGGQNKVAGKGVIHADYSGSFSGSTTPTIDADQDTSIIDSSGLMDF